MEPEIIPPGTRVPPRREPASGSGRRETAGSRASRDEGLDSIAHLLDDIFKIPGTNIRFGLDSLIGLVPGLGDLATSVLSIFIVYSAWQKGLPRTTQARMVANVAIDSVVGAIPLVGDLFDVAWKANRRNMELLHEAERLPKERGRRDAAFLAVLVVIILALMTIPVLAGLWLFRALFGS